MTSRGSRHRLTIDLLPSAVTCVLFIAAEQNFVVNVSSAHRTRASVIGGRSPNVARRGSRQGLPINLVPPAVTAILLVTGEQLPFIVTADTTLQGCNSVHGIARLCEITHRSNWNPNAGATETAMTAAEKIVVDRIVV